MKTILVLFGGCSTEYEVSLHSAYAVLSHMDPARYTPLAVGITREGQWLCYTGDLSRLEDGTWQQAADCIPCTPLVEREAHALLQLDGSGRRLLFDAVFPVLHGKNGEDGTVQGLFELAGVPVINGLTDYAHPCQVLADLMTIRERRGALEDQKLCFIGDGCSMANSLIVGGLLAGMTVSCVCPQGYRPAADVLMFAHKYGPKFHLLTDPAAGVKDADVVVTAAWNTAPGTPESERRLRDFAGFQVTSGLLSGAKSDAMLLHCLPAHRGEEISTAVFEQHADEIFTEAENRLHVQKAVLAILLANQ